MYIRISLNKVIFKVLRKGVLMCSSSSTLLIYLSLIIYTLSLTKLKIQKEFSGKNQKL